MTWKLVSMELKTGIPYCFAHIARLEAAGLFPSDATRRDMAACGHVMRNHDLLQENAGEAFSLIGWSKMWSL